MISINLDKAKLISHSLRRKARADEFAPLDDLISKQIPSVDVAAIEESRVAVRAKYDVIQTQIDAASSADELKSIIEKIR